MPFLSPGKRRESTNWTAEQYKYAIRRYFEAKGYALIHNSFREGTLADLIFIPTTVSQVKSTIWVESKYSEIGIEDTNLRIEIVKYLEEWLKLPPNRRFDFCVFVKKAKSPKKWERLFQYADKDFVEGWIKESIELSDSDYVKCSFLQRRKEIDEFFVTTYAYDWDIPDLERSMEEIKKSSILSLNNWAKKELDLMNSRLEFGTQRDKIFGNLLEITPPSAYWLIKFDELNDVYLDTHKSLLPPFAKLSRTELVTFNDKQTINLFREIKGAGRSISLTTMIDERSNSLFYLLNQAIGRIYLGLGAEYIEEKKLYYFPLSKNNKPFKLEGVNQRLVNMSRPFVKKNHEESEDLQLDFGIRKAEGKTLNFGFHWAFQLRVIRLWNVTFLMVSTKKLYTEDGKKPLDGERSKRIDKYFRKSKYNMSGHSRTLILTILHQFKLGVTRNVPLTYFSEFKIGKFLEFETQFSPVTFEPEQNVLDLEFKVELGGET